MLEHRTRSIFDCYNIVDQANLRRAGERLEEYAKGRKLDWAAPLQRVPERNHYKRHYSAGNVRGEQTA